MKKFFKCIGIFLLSVIIITIGVIYFNRNKLTFVKSLFDNYSDMSSITTSTFTNMDATDTMTEKDIIYSSYNGQQQTLDLFGPTKDLKNGSPVIMYVHGGSWIYGDNSIPQELSPLLDSFREQGFTIISVNYQLMREDIQLQKPVSDVKDAIRWVYKNKDKYNFNTEEIGLVGISSGAHLSLLAGYSDNSSFLGDTSLKDYPTTVKYIIDIAGPTDINSLIEKYPSNAIVAGLHGVDKVQDIAKYYSPVNYVNKNSPSTLIIHSESDSVVPYTNSTLLHEKLLQNGCDSTLISLKNSDHELSTIKNEDFKPLIIDALRFIMKNTPI